MRTIVVGLLCILFSGTALPARVLEKRLNYSIVIPEKPSKTQQCAAVELKRFLTETYDKPILLNGAADAMTFYIGISGESELTRDGENLQGDREFGIFVSGRSILFHGFDDPDDDPRRSLDGRAGTLLAVYYFLQKHAGAAFYFPGEKGYALTKNQPLHLTQHDLPQPTFTLRGFSLGTDEFSHEEKCLFFRRMLGSRPYWAFPQLRYQFMYNWKKRFWESNPEYFMIRKGERVSERYPWHAPCLSNPDVVKQAAADIVSAIKSKPAIKTVRLFCDAPIAACQCPGCRASKERDLAVARLDKTGEEVYGFQKKVADLVWREFPAIHFLTQTKPPSYCRPPNLVEFGPKFTVAILAQRRFDTDNWQRDLATNQAWRDVGIRTILKSYNRYAAWQWYPIIYPQKTLRYLRAFAGRNSGTALSELGKGSPYSFSALNNFTQARALFDIEVSYPSLLKEFCAFAYPGAEQEMAAFYEEMERICDLGTMNDNPFSNAYTLANLEKPLGLLRSATLKCQSIWFEKLHADFQRFYQHAERETLLLEEQLAQKVEFLKPPFLKLPPETEQQPELADWNDFLKIKFISPNAYRDFQETYLYLAFDRSNLYCGFELMENQSGILRAESGKNDLDALWKDDNLELMLVPSGQAESGFYYQIVANSDGLFRVLKHENGKHIDDAAFDVTVKTSIKKDRWLAFLKIPLPQFPKDSFKRDWLLGAFRTRQTTQKGNRQSSGVNLFSKRYHKLSDYPKLAWPPRVTK